jgi:predicted GIY-YIG superfamily endonuclease
LTRRLSRRSSKSAGGLRPEKPLKYVYILESLADAERFYVGVTSDLKARLKKHNTGEVSHTSKFSPWRMKTYIAFSDDRKAHEFERYLKCGSGRAFAKKRL